MPPARPGRRARAALRAGARGAAGRKARRPRRRRALDPAAIRAAQLDRIRALMLIRSYRVRGHLEARLDPLGLQMPKPHAELDPRILRLHRQPTCDRPIFIDNVLGRETATLREIMAILRETYCGPIGVEFMHIQDPDQKSWIQRRVEGAPWRTAFDADGQARASCEQLTEAEGFEAFCQKRYVTTKRFGLEGGEITIPALHTIIETAAAAGRERDRHRHAASRPAEHAGQHREEAAHRGVLRVRRRRASSRTTCRARAT